MFQLLQRRQRCCCPQKRLWTLGKAFRGFHSPLKKAAARISLENHLCSCTGVHLRGKLQVWCLLDKKFLGLRLCPDAQGFKAWWSSYELEKQIETNSRSRCQTPSPSVCFGFCSPFFPSPGKASHKYFQMERWDFSAIQVKFCEICFLEWHPCGWRLGGLALKISVVISL